MSPSAKLSPPHFPTPPPRPPPPPPPPPHPLVAEGAFWWGEAYTVALPRLKALPSSLQRLRALAMAVGRPPYSMIRCETRGHNHNHNHNYNHNYNRDRGTATMPMPIPLWHCGTAAPRLPQSHPHRTPPTPAAFTCLGHL